ncbi:MAG: peptide chain release factor N(5)-glutamine methyltransferase [Thermodesulfovibrionales bacterium]|nr:peptide chain release factor N(5)-glutamine methyltransferase [Thermodesulfovibrionales bacterium]
MRSRDLLAEAAAYLIEHSVSGAPREAETLLTEITGVRREDIYAKDPVIPEDKETIFRAAFKRRAGREPLQYITGTVDFADMRLKVGPGVLVPRPETELLVAEVAKRAQEPKKVLDLCTGSGCIALELERRFPEADIVGTDVSSEALAYARQNVSELESVNVNLMHGEMFAPVDGMRFDVIVANPPYIPAGEIDGLQPEVAKFEPRSALDGGTDGLDFYRVIARKAPGHMENGGLLALELGAGQAQEVVTMLKEHGFRDIEVLKDYAGHKRMLFCRFKMD